MSKKRIVTGIGVVLLTTGIIGCIWSGIVAMPKVINNFQTIPFSSFDKIMKKFYIKVKLT